ncbi:MAG: hypothetical protein ABI905_01740 [Betaproteobacteria bacterium]
MNETVVTIILAVVAAACIYAGYWAITRRATGTAYESAGGDPNALSADSPEVLKTR